MAATVSSPVNLTPSPKHRVRAAFLRSGRERTNSSEIPLLSIENADTETCMQEFYRCRNFSALRKILRKASQEWMTEFVENGGLVAIFEALSALGRKTVSTLADILPVLECVECLKAVMNCEQGLECVIESDGGKFVKQLVLGECIGIAIASMNSERGGARFQSVTLLRNFNT